MAKISAAVGATLLFLFASSSFADPPHHRAHHRHHHHHAHHVKH